MSDAPCRFACGCEVEALSPPTPLPCLHGYASNYCCGGKCWGKVDYVCHDCGAPNSWHMRECPTDTEGP